MIYDDFDIEFTKLFQNSSLSDLVITAALTAIHQSDIDHKQYVASVMACDLLTRATIAALYMVTRAADIALKYNMTSLKPKAPLISRHFMRICHAAGMQGTSAITEIIDAALNGQAKHCPAQSEFSRAQQNYTQMAHKNTQKVS